MNAPDEKRRLIDEFHEFKELLRHTGGPQAEEETARRPPAAAPTNFASRGFTPDDPLAAQALRQSRDFVAVEPTRAPESDIAALGVEPPPPLRPGAPESGAARKASRHAAADRGARPRRSIFLAAALAIVGIGVAATTAYLWTAPSDWPDTATTEADTQAVTAEEDTSTEAPPRDASLGDAPDTTASAPAEPPAEELRAEPAPPSETTADAVPQRPAEAPRQAETPRQVEAPRQAALPERKEDARPTTALPTDAFSPNAVSPSAATLPTPAASPLAPVAALPAPTPVPAPARHAAPPAQAVAPKPAAAPAKARDKAHDRSKPAQAAKPKAAETAPKPRQAPVTDAPPPPPPAPPPEAAVQPPPAPIEQPGFVERAVDSVTGAVKDLGKMATGVIP